MRKLPENIRRKIEGKLSALVADPMAVNHNVKPMKGAPGFRLRVGEWRALYEIDHTQRRLRVRRVGSRGDGYKP